jgi:hypothetical protein
MFATPASMMEMLLHDSTLDAMSKEFAEMIDSCLHVSPMRLEKVLLTMEFRGDSLHVRQQARMAESDSSSADVNFFYARTDSYMNYPEPAYSSEESHEQVHEMTLPRPVRWKGKDALQLTLGETATNYASNLMVHVEEDFFLIRKN